MYVDYAYSDADDAIVSTLQSEGEVYITKLISSILANDVYSFPIHRLNSGPEGLRWKLSWSLLIITTVFLRIQHTFMHTK